MLIVLKSGSLDLLELSWPVQACNGINLPFSYQVSPKIWRLEIFRKINVDQAVRIPGNNLDFKGLNRAFITNLNPLNPELNPICYLLALLAHHFLHVSRIRVKSLTLRLLMSYIYLYIYIYIYGAPILDVSRSHTTTHHSR